MYLSTIPLASLTPEYVRKHYLTGLKLVDDRGEDLDDDWYTEHIATAIAKIESITNIDILQRVNVGEKHDYRIQDYIQYCFLQLFRVPALSVQAVRAVYPTREVLQVFPSEWIRLEPSHSQIHLVPTQGTLSNVVIGRGGDYVPLFSSLSYLPQLWEVDYISGFDPEAIPREVVQAICKLACIEMLQIVADTIAPLGQTSNSLSIDGLSQSRSYNLPVFKARIDKYSADLGLPTSPGAPMGGGMLSQIRAAYLGINLASI